MSQVCVNFRIHESMKEEVATKARNEGVTMTEFIKLSMHHYMRYLAERNNESALKK